MVVIPSHTALMASGEYAIVENSYRDEQRLLWPDTPKGLTVSANPRLNPDRVLIFETRRYFDYSFVAGFSGPQHREDHFFMGLRSAVPRLKAGFYARNYGWGSSVVDRGERDVKIFDVVTAVHGRVDPREKLNKNVRSFNIDHGFFSQHDREERYGEGAPG